MALLKTLDDLADWDGYRKFLTTELKAIKDDEAPFHISKDDFDFEVKGKPWSGRVVLFGDKGDSSMASLKKAGIQFRSGTCRKDGNTLLVTGISGSLLKAGNKTFGKLPMSCTAVVAGEDPGDETEGEEAPKGKEQDDTTGGVDEKAKAEHKKKKAEVFAVLKKALADNPSNRSDLVTLYGKAEALEKKADFAGAAKIFTELEKLLAANDAADAKTAEQAEAAAADDEKTKAEHKKRKAEIFGVLKAALANNPNNRADLVALYGKAEALEKKSDFAGAADIFDELEDLLEAADEQGEVEAETEEDETGVEQGQAAQQKKPLYKRVKQVVESNPEQREAIARLVQRAERDEKAGDFAAVLETYEELETALDAVGEDADDEDVEIDPKSMRDWIQYRLWVRARIRRLAQDPAAVEPFYVSRKKYEFDINGKPWRGHAVLMGKKARTVLKALKQEGLQFVRGDTYRDGKWLVPSGVASTALKVAAKTLKMLRLGFKIRGADEDEDEGVELETGTETGTGNEAAAFARRREALSGRLQAALSAGRGDTSRMRATDAFAQESAEGGNWEAAMSTLTRLEALLAEAEGGKSETDTIAPGLVEYRKSLLSFAQTKTGVRQQLSSLESQVSALPGEEDLAKELTARLETMFEEIGDVVDDAINASEDDREPVTAAVRSQLQAAIADVDSDQLLAHVEASPWGVSIKGPLLRALSEIEAAMPA